VNAKPQRTIRREVSFEGIGLHTGARGEVTFRPAPPNSGIRFLRGDLPGKAEVQVRPENAHFDPGAGRRTILQQGDVQIHTMEHILAAVSGLGIDNLVIETSTMETPEPIDGSAAPIARLLKEAGIEDQERPKRHLKVTKPVQWRHDGIELSAVPYNGFKLDFTIDFPHPVFGTENRHVVVDFAEHSYVKEVARARTFGFMQDVEAMRSAGLALGGSLQNAIVLDETRVLNTEGLRYDNESVKHKVLDAIGDLYLLGRPLIGQYTAFKPGHALNNALARALLARTDAWDLVSFDTDDDVPSAFQDWAAIGAA